MSEREIVTLGQIRHELVRAVQRLVPVEEATALVIATHALNGKASGVHDPLDRFIGEMIVRVGNPRARCRSSDLYAAWEAWCAGRGVDPGSHKSFSMGMVERGFRKVRTQFGSEFLGIVPAECPGAVKGSGDAC